MFRQTITTKGAKLLATCSAALLLAGCAGGFSSDLVETRISTENTRANCSLNGTGYSHALQTPGHVVLPKGAAPVILSCQAPGYRTFVTTLRPLFNGKLLGNVLAVSSMGVFIDMQNGHGEKYPKRVHIEMEPTSFPTAQARDGWYRRYRGHVARKWARIVGAADDVCNENTGEEGNCRSGLQALKADRDREFQLLEARRRTARIHTQSTAQGLQPRL